MPAVLTAILLLMVASSGLHVATQGQPDPSSPRVQAAMALRTLFDSSGPEPIEAFIDERVAPALRQDVGDEALRQRLGALREQYAGAAPGGLMRTGEFAVRMTFGAVEPLEFELEPEPPHRFVRLGPLGHASPGRGPGERAAAGPPPYSTFDELAAHLTAEAAAGRFSGVVLVARGDEVRFHEAYGLADRKAGVPNQKDTKFNLGSINKLFTAIAVYQLVEKGAIGLDDPIGKHLPMFPEPARSQVTVQHLLDHRSGWGAYWDNPQWLARRGSLRTVGEYMAILKDIPLGFEPGTSQQYSNIGYEVLGGIIEAVTGRSYYDHVRAHVFEPAGMRDTDSYEQDRPVPNRAAGYVGPGPDETNAGMMPVKGTPAGGGYSTAADLLAFARALASGRLVSERFAARYEGMGAGGGAPGINAMLEMGVAGGHTVVVLANLSPPAAEGVALGVSRMLASGSEK